MTTIEQHIPSLTPATLNNTFLGHVEYMSYFSPPECDAIIALAQTFPSETSTITNQRVENDEIRKGTVRWIPNNGQHTWLWEKINKLLSLANESFYGFDIVGAMEQLQFTEYETTGDHYSWHTDYGPGKLSVRKLSVSVELSDPSTYEVVFPSYTLHRVSPLTSGKRYSLVLWASGMCSYR
jgi:PKHD-type hydroxylase